MLDSICLLFMFISIIWTLHYFLMLLPLFIDCLDKISSNIYSDLVEFIQNYLYMMSGKGQGGNCGFPGNSGGGPNGPLNPNPNKGPNPGSGPVTNQQNKRKKTEKNNNEVTRPEVENTEFEPYVWKVREGEKSVSLGQFFVDNLDKLKQEEKEEREEIKKEKARRQRKWYNNRSPEQI